MEAMMFLLLDNFKIELNNRNYSKNTIRLYSNAILSFLRFVKNDFNNEEKKIKTYLNYIKSPEMRRINYNAIKTFYKFSMHKNCPYQLEKVRGRKRLPNILSHNEIILILQTIKNATHHSMISMLYGSGLRVSDLVNLKVKDLDLDSLLLTIRQGKGNKDRITTISEKLKPCLESLIKNKLSTDFVFTTTSSNKYSIRTIQKIFQTALANSKINKKATCHSLRHSFATNLIKNGVDISVIKSLMGHKSIKTTMIYLHLADSEINRVKSPL